MPARQERVGMGRRCSGQWSLGESKVVRSPWKGKMRLNLERPSRWREERECQRPQSEGRGRGAVSQEKVGLCSCSSREFYLRENSDHVHPSLFSSPFSYRLNRVPLQIPLLKS